MTPSTRMGAPTPVSALRYMCNGLRTTNIPYAKENFWMSKYQQVIRHTPVARPAATCTTTRTTRPA